MGYVVPSGQQLGIIHRRNHDCFYYLQLKSGFSAPLRQLKEFLLWRSLIVTGSHFSYFTTSRLVEETNSFVYDTFCFASHTEN